MLGTFGLRGTSYNESGKNCIGRKFNIFFSSNIYYSYQMNEMDEECGMDGQNTNAYVVLWTET